MAQRFRRAGIRSTCAATRLCAVLLAWTAFSADLNSPVEARTTPTPEGFILTEIVDKPPGSTGWPTVQSNQRWIRAEFTLWYRDQTHWRLAGHYLEPPRNRFLLRNGLVSIPFTPYPGVVVDNGRTIWHYNSRNHSASTLPRVSDALDRAPDKLTSLTLGHPRAPSLIDLVTRVRTCRSLRLLGTTRIAGRTAYQINVGQDRCNRNSAAGSLDVGAEVAWVDKKSLIPLRLDKYYPGTGHTLLFRETAVRLLYNVRLGSRLFYFKPSPGAMGK